MWVVFFITLEAVLSVKPAIAMVVEQLPECSDKVKLQGIRNNYLSAMRVFYLNYYSKSKNKTYKK